MIANCPTPEKLQSLTLGELTEEQSDVVLLHLEHCESCQEEISQIDDGEDTFIRQIKTAGSENANEFESEKGCRVAVSRALAALSNAAEGKHGIPDVPSSIGEYEIVEPLGQGGMGHVYLGRHTKLSRPVAIKFIADHRRWDQTMHERFASEMRLIGGLKHPNIVVAHDAREVDGLAVLVTEYIDGMTVSEILKRTSKLDNADACKIVGEVCKALNYIDSKGLVHRDIKPSNIMIDNEGSVKLLDLGLARLQANDEMTADFTATGQAMGTADYVAPEQVNDSRNVDIRSDLYGLGCTFYKLLSGRAPFAGKHSTAFAKMNAHVSEAPERLSGVSNDLSKLVDRMLEKNPANRPQKPDDVLKQIEKHASRSDLSSLIAKARTMPLQKPSLANVALSATKSLKTEGSFFNKYPLATALAGALAAFAFGMFLGIVLTVKKPDGSVAKIEIPNGATAIVDAEGNIEIHLAGAKEGFIPKDRVEGSEVQAALTLQKEIHKRYEEYQSKKERYDELLKEKRGVIVAENGMNLHEAKVLELGRQIESDQIKLKERQADRQRALSALKDGDESVRAYLWVLKQSNKIKNGDGTTAKDRQQILQLYTQALEQLIVNIQESIGIKTDEYRKHYAEAMRIAGLRDEIASVQEEMEQIDKYLELAHGRVSELAQNSINTQAKPGGLNEALGPRKDSSSKLLARPLEEAAMKSKTLVDTGETPAKGMGMGVVKVPKNSPINGKIAEGDLIDIVVLSADSSSDSQLEMLASKVVVQSVHDVTGRRKNDRNAFVEYKNSAIEISQDIVDQINNTLRADKRIIMEFHDPDRQQRYDTVRIQGVWRPILTLEDGKSIEFDGSARFLFHRNQLYLFGKDNVEQLDYDIAGSAGGPSLIIEGSKAPYRFLKNGMIDLFDGRKTNGISNRSFQRLEKVETPNTPKEKMAFQMLESRVQKVVEFQCFVAQDSDGKDLDPNEPPVLRVLGPTGQVIDISGGPVITNKDVLSAKVTKENGIQGLAIKLTEEGGIRMGLVTQANLKKKMAIYIDGKVAMAPVINSPIYADLVVNGNFTEKELNRLADSIAPRLELPKPVLKVVGRAKSLKNLQSIMLGILNYESAYQSFPTWSFAKKGEHPVSWRVQVLPFIGHGELFNKYNPKEPWDSEANKEVLKNMPDVFRHPSAPKDSKKTNYIGIAGPNGALGVKDRSGYSFGNITDGSSNTVFLIETKAKIPWTKPEDFILDLSNKDSKDLFDRLIKFEYIDDEGVAVGWGDAHCSMLDRAKLTPNADSKFDNGNFKSESTLIKLFAIGDGSVIEGENLELKKSAYNLIQQKNK